MGTAAVISPVESLTYNDHKYVFSENGKPGPITQKLYDELFGIQTGDLPDKYGWTIKLT